MDNSIKNDPSLSQSTLTGASVQGSKTPAVEGAARKSVFKDDEREPKDTITLSLAAQKHVQFINSTLRQAFRSGITSPKEARQYVYSALKAQQQPS